MNHIKKYLKRSPVLFRVAKHLYNFLEPLTIPLEFLRYKANLILGRPYFGKIFLAGQLWQNREPLMRSLIENEIKDKTNSNFNILEIGSWAGGSAILWATTLQKHKRDGMVYCIDHWEGGEGAPKAMKRAVKGDKIFKLFLHNIRISGVRDRVVILRGTSDSIAPTFVENFFDFVYVDGDHSYSQFRRDLLGFKKLVKVGGVLCGDDFELELSKVDASYAKEHKESDTIIDPRTGKGFHPGISVALHEIFGGVSSREGFWAIRRTADGWEFIDL